MSKLTLTLVAAAALSFFAVSKTFAEDPVPVTSQSTTTSQGTKFVDKDGDGLCDNFGTANQCTAKGQGKGCQGAGCGKGFVDANKDGLCDNAANRQGGKGQGKGQGQGKGKCCKR